MKFAPFWEDKKQIQNIHSSGLDDSGLDWTTTKSIYDDANKSIEKWIKRVHFVIVNVTLFCYIAPRPIISFIKYFTTDLGFDAFELPFPVLWVELNGMFQHVFELMYIYRFNLISFIRGKKRFPFNWKNLSGYLIAITLQCIMTVYIHFNFANTLAIPIVTYFFTTFEINDIKGILNSIDQNAEAEKNHLQSIKHFIETHSNLKQLSIKSVTA